VTGEPDRTAAGRTGVKICGITEPASLDAALEAGADWIGLVFFSRSPRCLDPRAAARLAERSAGRADVVGLFVKPTPDEIAAVLRDCALAALQLYAPEEEVAAMRDRFGLPVWRAVGVATTADLPTGSGAERLVVESRAAPDAERPGGNGCAFDWSVVRGWQAPRPWMLAGGLTPDNVAEAIRVSGAQAVDVSSGVEAGPGRKDPALIRRFIEAARAG
jgi:phosphoribosylanthranilate isomerase